MTAGGALMETLSLLRPLSAASWKACDTTGPPAPAGLRTRRDVAVAEADLYDDF